MDMIIHEMIRVTFNFLLLTGYVWPVSCLSKNCLVFANDIYAWCVKLIVDMTSVDSHWFWWFWPIFQTYMRTRKASRLLRIRHFSVLVSVILSDYEGHVRTRKISPLLMLQTFVLVWWFWPLLKVMGKSEKYNASTLFQCKCELTEHSLCLFFRQNRCIHHLFPRHFLQSTCQSMSWQTHKLTKRQRHQLPPSWSAQPTEKRQHLLPVLHQHPLGQLSNSSSSRLPRKQSHFPRHTLCCSHHQTKWWWSRGCIQVSNCEDFFLNLGLCQFLNTFEKSENVCFVALHRLWE